MSLKFNVLRAYEPVVLDSEDQRVLQAFVKAFFPGAAVDDIMQLHINRKGATPAALKSGVLELSLVACTWLTERELQKHIAAGNAPAVYGIGTNEPDDDQ